MCSENTTCYHWGISAVSFRPLSTERLILIGLTLTVLVGLVDPRSTAGTAGAGWA